MEKYSRLPHRVKEKRVSAIGLEPKVYLTIFTFLHIACILKIKTLHLVPLHMDTTWPYKHIIIYHSLARYSLFWLVNELLYLFLKVQTELEKHAQLGFV